MLLIGTGVVGLLAVRGSATGSGGGTGSVRDNPAPVPPVLNPGQVGLQNAGRARIQLADRTDPSRSLGVMGWASLEPTGPGQARVTEPYAIMSLGSGLVAHLSAQRGSMTFASRDQPEAAAFEGGVPIAVYAAPDPESFNPAAPPGPPVALLFAPRVGVNIPLGELAIPGDFRLSAPQGELRGRGLRLLVNQVAQRLELLEIEATEHLWYDPDRPAALPTTSAKPAPAGTAGAPATPPARPAPRPPVERFYALEAKDALTVTYQGTTLTADGVRILARLVDNRLADGALGGLSRLGGEAPTSPTDPAATARQKPPSDTAPNPPAAPPAPGALPIEGEPPSLAAPSDSAVVVRWTGPLLVQPLEGPPPMLARDDLLARAWSAAEGGTRVTDRRLGVTTASGALSYGATSRELALSSSEPLGVLIDQTGRGTLSATSVTVNLATGRAFADGPGVVRAATGGTPTGDSAGSIGWNDSAELTLATERGWLAQGRSAGVRSALFRGGVRGRSGRALLEAEELEATFSAPGTAPGAPAGRPSLARVVAKAREGQPGEHVTVSDGPEGSVRARRLDVDFAPSTSGRPEPKLVTATDDVLLARGSLAIACGLLDVGFEPTAGGQSEPTTVRIQRGLTLADGPLTVRADSATADARRLTADLLGQAVTLDRDGARVLGTQIRLDGRRNELFVYGPGTFTFKRPAAPDGTTRAVDVTTSWTRSMQADDTAGRVELSGDAMAVSTPSADERQTLASHRVILTFTPGSTAGPLDATSGDLARARPTGLDRTLLRAEAVGAAEETDSGAPATIESVRFAPATAHNNPNANPDAPPPAARAIERRLFISGARVLADRLARPEESVFSVPGAGKLLIEDRTAKPVADRPPPSPPPDAPAFGSSRGTSLFTWQTDLVYERSAPPPPAANNPQEPDGRATMRGGVRLIHRAAPGDPVETLDCERLQARLRSATPASRSSSQPGEQTTLLGVTAEENVSLDARGRKLSADRATYDALAMIVEAFAKDGARVTLTDPAQAAPVTADRLSWDLRNNRVNVVGPGPVVVPR
jgi:hypothetical protein